MKSLPGVVEWTVYLLLLVLFSSLGVWQLRRADEKRAIADAINDRSAQPALSLNSPFSWNSETHQYRNVIVTGEFATSGQLMIDNIVVDGNPGYHVITPLKIADTDQYVLINRGWVGQAEKQRGPAETSIPADQVTIEGIMRTPSALPFVDSSTEPLSADKPFDVWLYLDVEKYQKESPLNMLPFAVLQKNNTSDGLHRKWPAYKAKTGMHIGYAIQWFAFAVIVTVIFVGLHKNRRKEKIEHEVQD